MGIALMEQPESARPTVRRPANGIWSDRLPRWLGSEEAPAPAVRRYHLARYLILRLLGLVYFTGFMILVNQGLPLIGSRGLLPVDEFTTRVAAQLGSNGAGFARLPSLFWFAHSDGLLLTLAWAGAALSLLVLCGVTNALLMAVLWALYMSFVHVGQDWYGYGWEIQLLETGFLAIFLCPLRTWRPFPRQPPALVVIWLFRWLIFRVMIGAGMIKMRGDPCWRELTCLDYHYETQPNPNPFSRTLHFAPHWISAGGVLFNHVTELAMPWLMLAGRFATRLAGVFFVGFQLFLIASGNLSFLNWLTIVPALACFDDAFLGRLLPRPLARWAETAERAAARSTGWEGGDDAAANRDAVTGGDESPSPAAWDGWVEPRWRARTREVTLVLLVLLVGALSVPVVTNLLSGNQRMNTSFGALDLVNTYGAFGTVGRERREIVFEGTSDARPDNHSVWQEYQFKCAPCDPARPPCLITPYHYRLDWQIWFAAMGAPEEYPWTLRFVWKLLHNDPGPLELLGDNPFPQAPPRFVRARLYTYRFAPRGSGLWWDRQLLGDWLPPLEVDDPRLLTFLEAYGWLDAGSGNPSATATPAGAGARP